MFALLDQIIFGRTFKAGAKTDFSTGLAYKSEDNVFASQTTKGELRKNEDSSFSIAHVE
jgi:hypothetical protein